MYTIVGNIFRTTQVIISDEEGNIKTVDFYSLDKETLDNTQNVSISNKKLSNFDDLPKYDKNMNPVTTQRLVQICDNPVRIMDATFKVYEIDSATLGQWKNGYAFYNFAKKTADKV